MPAKSCQCPERRMLIVSRRWEICSKPGDDTTIVCCKKCAALRQEQGEEMKGHEQGN